MALGDRAVQMWEEAGENEANYRTMSHGMAILLLYLNL